MRDATCYKARMRLAAGVLLCPSDDSAIAVPPTPLCAWKITMTRKINVFWSWQADSPGRVGRHFVKDCLAAACSELDAEAIDAARDDDNGAGLVVVKDTEGVGGSPAIASTILARIAASDVFVWDATLIADSPRMMPNPNVFFELGYAVACLGWSRIVGVTNHTLSLSSRAEDLPFDVRHHRAPLAYRLAEGASAEELKVARKTLTTEMKTAIAAALREPRQGLIADSADGDRLRRIVTAAGARQFDRALEGWISHASHWWRSVLERLDNLSDALDRPENQMGNHVLNAAADQLRTACTEASSLGGYKYFTDKRDPTKMYLGAKAAMREDGHYDRYDADLQSQLAHASQVLNKLRDAWVSFVRTALDHHPGIGELFE